MSTNYDLFINNERVRAPNQERFAAGSGIWTTIYRVRFDCRVQFGRELLE